MKLKMVVAAILLLANTTISYAQNERQISIDVAEGSPRWEESIPIAQLIGGAWYNLIVSFDSATAPAGFYYLYGGGLLYRGSDVVRAEIAGESNQSHSSSARTFTRRFQAEDSIVYELRAWAVNAIVRNLSVSVSLAVTPVPGPVAGAGLPLLAAVCMLLFRGRHRRNRSIVQ